MKRKLLLQFFLLSFTFFISWSQVPDGFNYQALARNASGDPIVNSTILVKISILSDTTGFYLTNAGTYIWEEQHSVTTNSIGLFSLVIGSTDATRIAGSASTFSEIDWNAGPAFIGIKIQPPSSAWTNLGTAKLWSVPYAMVSDKAIHADAASGLASGSKISVTGKDDTSQEALFEVKRQDGQTVFAVYPDAVNVYVPRSAKGVKGGFAIGGFDGSKAAPQDYFRVTPDSVRIYIDPTPAETKGVKGGFAIGGFVGEKGGLDDMYFNLSGGSTVNTVNESPQILWYPIKKAFLAGTVHIGAVDSVGENSTALGFRSIAMGQYSQAFGYKAKAFGDYSTSIGKNSVAGSKSIPLANNAFAFGDAAKALGNKSIAFGNDSRATNTNSLAIGNGTISSGINSTAMGYQSQANGELSIALGSYYSYTFAKLPYFSSTKGETKGDFDFIIRPPVITPLFKTITFSRGNIANGKYSISIGNGNLSNNGGLALGSNNDATEFGSVTIGLSNKAVSTNAFAAGYNNLATGFYATAFGNNTYSKSYGSFVIGQYNVVAGDSTQWIETDPLFIVGNGLNNADRSNALTIYKNGRTIFMGADANVSINDRLIRFMYNPITRTFTTNHSVYGLKSYVNRANTDVDYYYSGYFYNTGTAGTYNGLYADERTGGFIDLAEYIYSDGQPAPADVVIADPNKKESVTKSSKPYQSSVLGVISTKPHLTMGMELVTDPITGEPIANVSAARLALSGRVPINVTGENGSIVPGDYLTSSSTPGAAMKWTLLDVNEAKDFDDLKRILAENEKRRNAIIGKAVESFSGQGTGKIIVLVSLQ